MTDRERVDIEALIDDVRDNVEAPELEHDMVRALRELRTLRALAERVERAPVYAVTWYAGAPFTGPIIKIDGTQMLGKRVALVEVTGDGNG